MFHRHNIAKCPISVSYRTFKKKFVIIKKTPLFIIFFWYSFCSLQWNLAVSNIFHLFFSLCSLEFPKKRMLNYNQYFVLNFLILSQNKKSMPEILHKIQPFSNRSWTVLIDAGAHNWLCTLREIAAMVNNDSKLVWYSAPELIILNLFNSNSFVNRLFYFFLSFEFLMCIILKYRPWNKLSLVNLKSKMKVVKAANISELLLLLKYVRIFLSVRNSIVFQVP